MRSSSRTARVVVSPDSSARQGVARRLTLLHEVEMPTGGAGQPGDRVAEPVLAPIGELLDLTPVLQRRDEPGRSRLVHPQFGGDLGDACRTEACDDLHRVNARSTDCTVAERVPSSLSDLAV